MWGAAGESADDFGGMSAWIIATIPVTPGEVLTITADGVFWHPVGAEDNDLLVSREIFPLAEAFAAVRRAFDREHEHQRRLATIFNCA